MASQYKMRKIEKLQETQILNAMYDIFKKGPDKIYGVFNNIKKLMKINCH